MNDSDLGWYVRSRGRVLGPFQLAQLEVLKGQGRVAKFDEVSRDRRNWVRAATVPELFPPSAPPPESAGSSPGAGSARPHDASYAVVENDPAIGDDAAIWFYVTDTGQTGPVALSKLISLSRTGVVRAETFVWNSGMTDWIPARDVPALGLTLTPAALAPVAAPTAATFNVLALSGFVLGVLGLLAGAMGFVTSAFLSTADQNRDLLAVISFGFIAIWGLCSLLAVILSPIGMVRANRAGGERKGLGLGLAGMVLGIIGLLVLLILMFLAVLGVMASKGAR